MEKTFCDSLDNNNEGGNMRKTISLFILAALAMLGAASAFAAPRAGSAQYRITFIRLWTEKTFPFEYPEAGLLTGPHLSGLIGATHAAGSYAIYKLGTPPTPGLERLSEEGKHTPLDD